MASEIKVAERITPSVETIASITRGRSALDRATTRQSMFPARAEPKTRYRLLHAAARLTRGGRRRRLNIQASWPWTADIVTAWDRVSALPQAP